MTTAFVLSGGGNLGAAQVGMLLGLADRGVTPDLLVGTSAGAINAAHLAAGPSAARMQDLAALWCGLQRNDVFPSSLRLIGRAAAGRANHLVDPAPLRALLRTHLGYDRLEAARWPFAVVATEVTTGREVVLTSGDVVEAVAASAAIPGIFPPVEMEGHTLMDGGIVNHAPIAVAESMGADVVYVLPTGYACALDSPPSSVLGMTLHAVSLAIHQRLVADVASRRGQPGLYVVPPLCPVTVSPTDFRRAGELVGRARRATRAWLDRPPAADPVAELAVHEHRPGVPDARDHRADALSMQ